MFAPLWRTPLGRSDANSRLSSNDKPDRRPSHPGNVTVTFDNGDQYSQTSHPRDTTDRGPAAGATPCQAAPADLPTARRAGAASPATPQALGSSGGGADCSAGRIPRLARQPAGQPRRIEIGRQAPGDHRPRSRGTPGDRPAARLRPRLTEKETT